MLQLVERIKIIKYKDMKKILIAYALTLCFSIANAQNTKELFSKNNYNYYWYGIDYTNVKLIGDFYSSSFKGENEYKQIKEKFFPAWNALIKNERNKYNVSEIVRAPEVKYKTSMIDSLNTLINPEKLAANEEELITQENLEQQIKSYKLVENNGVGVVFLAESMNKAEAKASYVMVMFNIENRNILLQERFNTIPSGFGIRNFWAGSYYQIFKEMSTNKYWKRKQAENN